MGNDKNSPIQWLIKEAFVGQESGIKYPAHVTKDLSYGKYEGDMIHVVEYSAFEQAQARIAELLEGQKNSRSILNQWMDVDAEKSRKLYEYSQKIKSAEKMIEKTTKLQEAVKVLRAGIAQEIKDIGSCGCGYDEPMGEGYTGGVCSLHEALSKVDAILGQGEK